MAGKQAKTLTAKQIEIALRALADTRHASRNRLLFLLSVKAGLRACEMARLTWDMVTDSDGQIGPAIELTDAASKMGSGRTIPMHKSLREALTTWRHECQADKAYVICSERGDRMSAASVVNWFSKLYRSLDLQNCSSHSGRRTFITNLARELPRLGGSLRDVQELAGHKSLQVTQRYIEGDAEIKRRLIERL